MIVNETPTMFCLWVTSKVSAHLDFSEDGQLNIHAFICCFEQKFTNKLKIYIWYTNLDLKMSNRIHKNSNFPLEVFGNMWFSINRITQWDMHMEIWSINPRRWNQFQNGLLKIGTTFLSYWQHKSKLSKWDVLCSGCLPWFPDYKTTFIAFQVVFSLTFIFRLESLF